MEASVARSTDRLAFGVPHCQVCPLFLGQAVPVVATPRGYALFCEVCELGHGPITIRAGDARKMQIRVDEADEAPDSEEE